MYDNRMNGENSFHDVCDGELERVAFNWFHPFSLEPVPNMNKHIEKWTFLCVAVVSFFFFVFLKGLGLRWRHLVRLQTAK